LDKIIERNAAATAPTAAAPMGQLPQQSWGNAPNHHGRHKPYKRRKSFLEDLFD
jgi:uncharacterized protein